MIVGYSKEEGYFAQYRKLGMKFFYFFQQLSYVAKAKRQQQKSLTSIGGELNAILSHFSEGV